MKVQSLRTRIKEATSLAILDAAEQVASEDGLAATSLVAVAARAGVAVGTIYNHFQDREELVKALFARRRCEIFSAVDASTKKNARAPFHKQLTAYVRVLLEQFDERRVFLRIAIETDHLRAKVVSPDSTDPRPAMQQMQEGAARVVRVGIREGVLRAADADLIPLMLIGILKAILVARVSDPRPFVDETERVVKLFLHGAGK